MAGKKVAVAGHEKPASRLIDDKITRLGDWRGKTLAQVRRLIRQVDPDGVEG